MGVCAFSHAAIAVNRLLAVVFSNRYPAVKSPTVTFLLVALSWLLPACVFVIPLLTPKYGDFGLSNRSHRCAFLKLDSTYQMTYKALSALLPFAITVLAYLVIVTFVIASRQKLTQHANRHQLPNHVDAVNRGKKSNITSRKDLQATRMAFILCLAFLLCFIPNSVFGIVVSSLKGLQSMVGLGFAYWSWIGKQLYI